MSLMVLDLSTGKPLKPGQANYSRTNYETQSRGRNCDLHSDKTLNLICLVQCGAWSLLGRKEARPHFHRRRHAKRRRPAEAVPWALPPAQNQARAGAA